MRRITFVFTLMLLLAANLVLGQEVQTSGRLTNSVYVYEAPDAPGSSELVKTTRIYQFLRLDAGIKEYNSLTLHVAGRALTDVDQTLDERDRFHAYRLSLSAKGLFNNLMDVEVGRQFLHPGITFGSIDGANVKLYPMKNLAVQLFGGVESHLSHSLKVYYRADAAVYGGSAMYRNLYDTDLQLAYLQKQTSNDVQWQIAALNLTNRSLDDFLFKGQFHYDMVNSRLHRAYVATNWSGIEKLQIGLFFKQQYPQIYGDSFFQIFDIKQYTQAGLNASYELFDGYYLNAGLQHVMIEDASGQRITANISDEHGSIGAVYEMGDLGDQVGAMAAYGYSFLNDFTASVSVDYSRYRFEEIYDYENQLANALRLTYEYNRHLRVDAEYQWISNQLTDSDQRFLNHIHLIW